MPCSTAAPTTSRFPVEPRLLPERARKLLARSQALKPARLRCSQASWAGRQLVGHPARLGEHREDLGYKTNVLILGDSGRARG